MIKSKYSSKVNRDSHLYKWNPNSRTEGDTRYSFTNDRRFFHILYLGLSLEDAIDVKIVEMIYYSNLLYPAALACWFRWSMTSCIVTHTHSMNERFPHLKRIFSKETRKLRIFYLWRDRIPTTSRSNPPIERLLYRPHEYLLHVDSRFSFSQHGIFPSRDQVRFSEKVSRLVFGLITALSRQLTTNDRLSYCPFRIWFASSLSSSFKNDIYFDDMIFH